VVSVEMSVSGVFWRYWSMFVSFQGSIVVLENSGRAWGWLMRVNWLGSVDSSMCLSMLGSRDWIGGRLGWSLSSATADN
jgi:hypothetical protein